MDEKKGKIIEKYPELISIEITKNILEQMQKNICKIYNKDGAKQTAFFCKINKDDKYIPVMCTNYHVINSEYIKKNKSINISFNDDKEEKTLKLDDKRIIYTNEEYDTTIIEIIPEKDNINDFMELDESIFKDNSNTINKKSI